MKRVLIVLAVIILPFMTYAQSNLTDVITKYSNEEGVTTISINKVMLMLVASANDSPDSKEILNKLDNIMIFVSEEGDMSSMKKDVNSAIKSSKELVELMRIKEEGEDVTFYLNQKGESISELLMHIDGPNEFVMISIKGDFTIQDLAEISKSVDISGLDYLDKIEERK